MSTPARPSPGETTATTSAAIDLHHILDEVARRASACPPPDVWNGYDQCPTHPGSTWPCPNHGNRVAGTRPRSR